MLTKRLQDLIKTYRHRYVVCEATAEPQAYGDPAVCGGALAFGYVHQHIRAASGHADAPQKVVDYWKTASPTTATLLSNHDIFAGRRLWDQLDGFPDREARCKLAAAGYLLQPGTPFVYYGEEIGQAGVPGLAGDLPLRSPRSWTARGGFTERTMVVINCGTAAAPATLAQLPAGARLLPLWPRHGSSARAASDGSAPLHLPALSVTVFRVAAPATQQRR